MTSWTFRTRQFFPSTKGSSGAAAGTLGQTVRRIENRFRFALRSPSPSEMNRPTQDDDALLFRRHVGETRPVKGGQERVSPTHRPSRSRSDTPREAQGSGGDGYPLVPNREIERGTRIEFARPGLQRREIRRLRRGHHPIQDELDLHGLFASEAERAVLDFIDHSRGRGLRCVRIIHGKGRSSAKGRPVLKAVVDRWLRRCDGRACVLSRPGERGRNRSGPRPASRIADSGSQLGKSPIFRAGAPREPERSTSCFADGGSQPRDAASPGAGFQCQLAHHRRRIGAAR